MLYLYESEFYSGIPGVYELVSDDACAVVVVLDGLHLLERIEDALEGIVKVMSLRGEIAPHMEFEEALYEEVLIDARLKIECLFISLGEPFLLECGLPSDVYYLVGIALCGRLPVDCMPGVFCHLSFYGMNGQTSVPTITYAILMKMLQG